MKTFADHLAAVAADRPTAVYRFYGEGGQLLYVGITFNLGARFSYHQRHAPWFADHRSVKVVWYGTRAKAAAAESRAIREEKPLSNIAGTRTRRHSGAPAIEAATREAIAREVRGEVARYRLSKQVLRDALGLSRHSVCQRLAGRIPFRDQELRTIAELLGIPVSRLLPAQSPVLASLAMYDHLVSAVSA